MPRLTLASCANSRLPEAIGACSADIATIAQAVNSAQERLIYAKEAGDEGWLGLFAEVVFNVLQSDPFITLNRYWSMITDAMVCNQPIPVNNQFYEYLLFGNGRQPRFNCSTGNRVGGHCQVPTQGYQRGFWPTFKDLIPGHLVRVRAENALDTDGAKRVLIQGTDTNDTVITSLDGTLRVQGVYLNVISPFVDMPFPMNTVTGIQKDASNGPIQFWDVDPVTAAETLILTMDPGELVSGYTRYYFDKLPLNCCPVIQNASGQNTVQLRAMVKMALVPVIVPSDYLLIQSMEAIIAECQSSRYSTMDLPNAKQMAAASHIDAIRFLMGQLNYYYGTQKPALGYFPFGSARLERQGVGQLI